MPKLVVVVVEDDTGKPWNFIFTEEEWARNHNSFGSASQWIHKSDFPESVSEYSRPAEPTEKEHVTLRLLPPDEEPKIAPRTRSKSSSF